MDSSIMCVCVFKIIIFSHRNVIIITTSRELCYRQLGNTEPIAIVKRGQDAHAQCSSEPLPRKDIAIDHLITILSSKPCESHRYTSCLHVAHMEPFARVKTLLPTLAFSICAGAVWLQRVSWYTSVWALCTRSATSCRTWCPTSELAPTPKTSPPTRPLG